MSEFTEKSEVGQNRSDDPKLASQPPQVTQLVLTPHPHRNQQLFSDYYLDSILPGRADWQMLAGEAEAVMSDLQQLFARYTPTKREAQVEQDWIKPVLWRLGHTFEIQAPLATSDGNKVPDYVFYRDQ